MYLHTMMLQLVSERMNCNVHTLFDLAHLGVEAILFHGQTVLYAKQNKTKKTCSAFVLEEGDWGGTQSMLHHTPREEGSRSRVNNGMALKGPMVGCHWAATSAHKQSSPATEPRFVIAKCLQLSNWLAAAGRGSCQTTSSTAALLLLLLLLLLTAAHTTRPTCGQTGQATKK